MNCVIKPGEYVITESFETNRAVLQHLINCNIENPYKYKLERSTRVYACGIKRNGYISCTTLGNTVTFITFEEFETRLLNEESSTINYSIF